MQRKHYKKKISEIIFRFPSYDSCKLKKKGKICGKLSFNSFNFFSIVHSSWKALFRELFR